MAISPTVNQFMSQGQQAPEEPQDAESIFRRQFADQSFNMLKARFPALINQVVTFRTLAADMEKGTAFGVFILSAGDKLIYIPVTMNDGSITSLEMAYDKEGDQFFPLDAHTVKEITALGATMGPEIMQGNAHVEDTRQLFHNMMRPPTSSNVVLASEQGGISHLPNRCKEQLSSYLTNENPQLLAKVAEFYPVEYLGYQLRSVPEMPEKAKRNFPGVLKLASLTPEAACLLNSYEKKAILESGWLVKKDDANSYASPFEKLPEYVEHELHFSLYKPEDNSDKAIEPVYCADVVNVNDSGIDLTPAIIYGDKILADNGKSNIILNHGAVVHGLDTQFTDLPDFPAIKKFSELPASSNDKAVLDIFVPLRNGCYGHLDYYFTEFKKADDALHILNYFTIRCSPDLTYGYVRLSDNCLLLPEGALFALRDAASEKLPVISDLSTLITVIRNFGSKLSTIIDDGAGITIKDQEKTASFASAADAAEWLNDRYGLDASGIETVLNNKHALVFTKTAFMDPLPEEMQAPQNPYASQMPQDAEQPQTQEMPAQEPDFSNLQDFANMEDTDLFDTGVLASFAQYPDIKALLVEYLPDFLAAEDKIGRILLAFCSQKKEIEKFYGTEKSSILLSSCRRIFSILGDLVASLKLYVNMA